MAEGVKKRARSTAHSRSKPKGSGAVGIKLIVEVLANAPIELTSSERLLLVVLAEQAREETRECWPGMDFICERTGLTQDAVRKVLQRLAARGFETRVAVGKDKKGRPVYAYEGASTKYRIPRFPTRSGGTGFPPPDDWSRDHSPATGGRKPGAGPRLEAVLRSPQEPGPESRHSPQEAGPQSQRGGTVVPKRRDSSTALPLSSPQFPSSLSASLAAIRAANVVTEEEERDFEAWLIETLKPRSPAWWRRVADNGDLAHHAAEWRKTREPKRPARPPLAECAKCDTPTRQLGADGLCAACRTDAARPSIDDIWRDAKEVLDEEESESNRVNAEAAARAEGLTDTRAIEIYAAEYLLALEKRAAQDQADEGP